jgi:glycosyltransferase involved in cell wall biosynthesis
MKVLMLLHEAFGGRGGIAKFNRDLITSICAHRDVRAVTAIPRLVTDPTGPIPEKLSFPTGGLWGKASWFLRVAAAALARTRYDLILCGHVNLLPAALAVRLCHPAPVGLIVHGIEAWHPTGRRLTDRLAGRIDFLISVSSVTRSRFASWAGADSAQSFILPNTVDTARFRPGPENPALMQRWGLSGRRVLLTLARLEARERYKGIDEILEILPGLIADFPDLAYVVAGDGSDRPRLEDKARSLGVADRVVFTGYVAEGEKLDLYRAADAFAMPGHGEGFGIVFLEAMACGIPVVASTLDGSREAVREGALGLAVNPTDPVALRAAIRTALSRPRGVVPDGLAYFDMHHFEQRVHAILNQVSGANARAHAAAQPTSGR